MYVTYIFRLVTRAQFHLARFDIFITIKQILLDRKETWYSCITRWITEYILSLCIRNAIICPRYTSQYPTEMTYNPGEETRRGVMIYGDAFYQGNITLLLVSKIRSPSCGRILILLLLPMSSLLIPTIKMIINYLPF